MKLSRKKHILILTAIGLVYFIGIAAIVYPIIGNIYSINSSRAVISSYASKVEKMSSDEIETKFRNARKYNEDVAQKIYNDGYERSLNLEDDLMCYVEIPKQEIFLPVYYGTGTDVLQKGCGWLENTSLPIGGASTHASISGHTGLPNAEMFSKLDSSSIGDVFYIHVLDRTLAYRVDRIETVDPNDVKHLYIIDGEDHVTLVTCTPYGINDKRLLVRGVRFFPETEEKTDDSDSARFETVSEAAARANAALQKQIDKSLGIVIAIVGVSVVLFAGACVWVTLSFRARRLKSESAKKNRSEDDDGEAKK